MAIKYHINPERGPLVCSASTPEKCHYGANAEHYGDLQEANSVWQGSLSEKYGTFSTSKNPVTVKRQKTKAKFAKEFESMEFEDIQEFADASADNHKIVDEIINDRANEAVVIKRKLDEVNPYQVSDSTRKCDKETYAEMLRDANDYRDRTAELVEAHTESRFYKPLAVSSDPDNIGSAIKVQSLVPNSSEWIMNRSNVIGGSDVGLLVMKDFMKPSERPYYADGALARVEKMKSSGVSVSDIDKIKADSHGRVGAMYRGTVWEPRVRDSYVADNPDVDVIDTKGQYAHSDRPWQQINVDGLIVPKGSDTPVGILEVKTAASDKGWETDVPVSYRAQTLYYLNATGLEYADVRVLVNDKDIIDRRVYANEPIHSATSVTMEEYVNNRVSPWFDKMKSQREQKGL